MAELSRVTIEDAQIIFRNFEGKEGPFNDKGNRGFSVVLTPDVAEDLAELGWNVKTRDPREEGDDPLLHLPVRVSFDNYPPRITMIANGRRTTLTESMVAVLDFADIIKVDVVINPYVWNVGDKTGVKAYLKTMFITIDEDELERKYALEEAAAQD